MLKKLLFAALLSLIGATAEASKTIPPAPRNYIYDETGLLASSTDSLSSLLSQEDRQFGNQILVAVFNSLEQEDPVDYTNRLFSAWQPGEKGKDKGVLLAVYLQEKKIRIEVGYGLEPLLTDAKSKRIIVDYISPAFKEKKYSEGIISAVQALQNIIHADADSVTNSPPRKKGPFRPIYLLIIIVLFVIINFLDGILPQTLGSHGISRKTRWRSGGGGFGGGSGWGGGFGGSSGGGGGGFIGGGGMSGGGGASGDW